MGNKPRAVSCEKLIESFQNSNLQSVLSGNHDLFQSVHQGMVTSSMASPLHPPLDSFPRAPEAGNLLELLVQSGNQNSISSGNQSDVLGSLGGPGGGGVMGGKSLDASKKSWTSPTKLPPSSLWMLQHHIDKLNLPNLPGLAGSATTSPKTAGGVITSSASSVTVAAAASEERGVCHTRPHQQPPPLWCDRNGGGKHPGDGVMVVEKAGVPTKAALAMLVKPDRSLSSEVFAIGAESPSPRAMSKDMGEMDTKMLDSSDCSDHNMDEHEEKNVSNSQLGIGRPVSKNLVSERKRRKKLNEGLYTLRALVPRISKMDKASIIGDAIDYVRELQKQVEELQAGISDMEASAAGEEVLSSVVAETSGAQVSDARCWEEDGSGNSDDKANGTEDNLSDLTAESSEQKILELDVSLMEDQIYHLRIFCTKGPGVFVQLMQSLEAIGLEVLNANLTSLQDNILNTFIAEIKDWEMMKTEDVKKAIMDVASRFGLQ
ncbi:unnamed protein product [Calypogeia fissa]